MLAAALVAFVVAQAPMPSAGVDARIAIGGDLVVTAAGRTVRVHHTFGDDDVTTIRCDAVDVVARAGFGDAEWAVLCVDRIVWKHGASTSEIPLDRGAPTAFAMTAAARFLVGFADGTLAEYGGDHTRVARYGRPILGVADVEGSDGAAFTDAPCNACRAVPLDDSALGSQRAWVGGRVRDDVKHGGILVPPDVADVALGNGKLCVTRGSTFTCEDRRIEGVVEPEPEAPPVDVFAPAVLTAAGLGVAGLAALAASPFVVGAFGASTSQALAVSGLLALGGAGIAIGVTVAVLGVGLLVLASTAPHFASDGSCLGDAFSQCGNAASDCVSTIAVATGIGALVASAALVAGGVAAAYAAPHADAALARSAPAHDPFWAALLGAAAGGALGMLGTVAMAADDDPLGDDQRALQTSLTDAAAFTLVFGGAALGGTLGYGVGEGGRATR